MKSLARLYSNNKYSEIITAYIFLLPVIILWGIWFLYPFVRSFIISFFDYNYIKTEGNHFVGLGNYIALFKDEYFFKALKNSAFLTFFVVPMQSFIALLIAMAMNKKIILRSVFRVINYLPSVVSPIAVTTVFMYFFIKGAVMTKFFSLFALENVTWFADLELALPFIAIIYIWQHIGFYMVIYLGGLQTVPLELYESSIIDGANGFKKFIYITFPMLKSVTFLVLTSGMIQAFQVFDQVVAISSRSGSLGAPAGATSTLVSYFYLQSFRYMQMGYGSSVAIIIFLLIFTVTMIQKKLVGGSEYE